MGTERLTPSPSRAGRAAAAPPATTTTAPATTTAVLAPSFSPPASPAPERPDPVVHQRLSARACASRLRATLRRPGGRRAVALLTAGLLGLLLGWSGDAAWRSAQADDARLRTAGLSVVVSDAQRTDESALRTSAELTIEVTNLGLVPMAVVGSELTYDAAAVVSIEPPQFTVPVDGSRSALLQVAVGCRSAQPLDLPPLQARAPDGSLLSVVVDGAGQVLTQLCDSGPEVDQVLRAVAIARDGVRLRIALMAPGGRTTEVQSVRAGGVALTGRPLPAMIEGVPRSIWLQPPIDCPETWRQTGLPQDLQIDVDIGTDATVTLPIGYQLASWLLDGPCAAAVP
jgi:hypothetical protein